MDSCSNFYIVEDNRPLKTLTLKSGYSKEGPETLFDPESKRQYKTLDKRLRKQKIIGLIVTIFVVAYLCGYTAYDILYSW